MGQAVGQRPILVPLDGSEAAEAALSVAGMLARVTGAPLRLLHVAAEPRAVVDDGEVLACGDEEQQRLHGEAEDYLERLDDRLAGLPVEHVVRFGGPAAEILAEARACGAALVVVASRGLSGAAQRLVGRVARAVAREAGCPVVTVAGGPAVPASRPPAAARVCLACGVASPATFCPACEARIRGEALEHKLGEERAGRRGRAV